jgi:ubiquinol-cytochrome c reductase subunit 6
MSSEYEQCHVAEEVRKECLPHCVKFKQALDECADRFEKIPDPNAHCEYQFFDYWECMDHCVAPKLFKKLK